MYRYMDYYIYDYLMHKKCKDLNKIQIYFKFCHT